MILLFLVCTSAILLQPSWGGLSQSEFENSLELTCFNKEEPNEPVLTNGQENPLSQTLENFISLAEKLEIANPTLMLKDELFHFIRNYTFENIEIRDSGDVGHWAPKDSQQDILNTYWEPSTSVRDRDQQITVPYSNSEICNLFFMLSHSILPKPPPETLLRSATNTNNTNIRIKKESFIKDEDIFPVGIGDITVNGLNKVLYASRRNKQESYIKDEANYPMEIGVVSVNGTTDVIALGKVLMGMYVGLSPNSKRPITEDKRDIPQDKLPDGDNMIDTLYALTMAEVIALSKWRPELGGRDGLAPDGSWLSVKVGTELETKDVCPMIYRLKDGTLSSQSYSSVRGAADGLILGKVIKSILVTKGEIKLSEILRMYYSRGGIAAKTEESTDMWASFCNRAYNLENALESFIKPQVKLYKLLVGSSYKLVDENWNKAWDYYQTHKSYIFRMDRDFQNFCSADLSADKPENLPLESPLDIIAVMDTSFGQDIIRKQQLILGYLAKKLELRFYGSRMTILTDQKMPTTNSASSSGTVVLKSIVEDTFSSACAACLVTQVTPEDSGASAPESDVIFAIDQLLQAKKENGSKYSGVKGKVVVYFNFQEPKTTSRIDQEQVRADKALKDLLTRNIDVAIYALGRSKDLVEKYARKSSYFTMSAVDQTEPEVAEALFNSIFTAPATLQYTDCDKATNENGAIYEDYVSRNAIQHWQMPAKYFYKSRSLKFTFESSYGALKVCHSRATTKTETVQDTCEKGTKIVFKDTNPCKGFDDFSCAPFFFSIIGMNNTDDVTRGICKDTTTENKCKTMDQIKFKITHDGIRCSGGTWLLTSPIVLFLGVLLFFTFSKAH